MMHALLSAMPPPRPRLVAIAIIGALVCSAAVSPAPASDERVLIVRERAAALLQDGSFRFELLKIRGYFIDIRVDGERRRLKLGDTFGPHDAGCAVHFDEISPETRIARFKTNCS